MAEQDFVSSYADVAAPMPVREDLDGPYLAYNLHMKAPIHTKVGKDPMVTIHAGEWRKLLAGDAVEVNPSVGLGLKVMTIDEWASRFKRNDDFPECLCCGSKRTVEHYFESLASRGKFCWDNESLCLDCLMFSYRSYHDPEYLDPREHEKLYWGKYVHEVDEYAKMRNGLVPLLSN